MSDRRKYSEARRRFKRTVFELTERAREKELAEMHFEWAMKDAIRAAAACKALEDARAAKALWVTES